MRNSSGWYPHVRVDAVGAGVVSQAGGVLLVETARTAGLDQALKAELAGWRKPLAVHDPGKVVLDLAVMLALGGDCLADVAVLRSEPGVYGRWRPTRRCPGCSTRWPPTRREPSPRSLRLARIFRAPSRQEVSDG